jgi:hypothetical protein
VLDSQINTIQYPDLIAVAATKYFRDASGGQNRRANGTSG